MSNVVVVGAGLAGLAAARRLMAHGHEVVVVEARERVGGRTEGLVLEDGTPLELGGQWIGEGHARMYELAGELGLPTFRTWNDERQHGLFYTHSNADLETLISVDRGAQQDRVTGGSVLVAEAMAAGLDERIVLGRPVRRIEQDDNGIRVIARDGSEYRGDAAVVTLPPTLAGRLEYDPPLPSWRDQLTQRMPAGSVIKAFAIYPEPFWRQDGLNGQAVSDTGPVKVTFDNSPPSGTPGVLMGFLEGKQARMWARRSQDERREAVIGCFVRYFGQAAARPAQYVERDWMAGEFTRGCYGAHFAPGVWTSYGEAWRAPAGRVHWAGTECASHWNGYMEGAVRSGETAADAVGAL